MKDGSRRLSLEKEPYCVSRAQSAPPGPSTLQATTTNPISTAIGQFFLF